MLVGNTQPSKFTRSYPVAVQNVLEHINSLDTDALAIGRHTLPGFDAEQAWFVVLEYKKEPLACFKPEVHKHYSDCLLYTSPSPRDRQKSRMPSSA